MKIFAGTKPTEAVYIQMRQVMRGKDGKMKVTKTKTITIHNTTIEKVRGVLEKGEQNGE